MVEPGVVDCVELAELWSGVARAPRDLILMRLGHWAHAGVFGEDAFLVRWGGPLDTRAAARSLWRMAVESDHQALEDETSASPSDFDWPFIRLDALARFCVATRTSPPLGLLEDDFTDAKHAFPPAAPDADIIAIEAAVTWLERLVERVTSNRSTEDARIDLAKREVRVLLRARKRDASVEHARRRYRAALSGLAEWKGQPDPYRSGFPGRPGKLKHAVQREFGRRAEAGEIRDRVTDEARVLQEWAAQAHPRAPLPTVKTIANNIRFEFHQYWSQRARN